VRSTNSPNLAHTLAAFFLVFYWWSLQKLVVRKLQTFEFNWHICWVYWNTWHQLVDLPLEFSVKNCSFNDIDHHLFHKKSCTVEKPWWIDVSDTPGKSSEFKNFVELIDYFALIHNSIDGLKLCCFWYSVLNAEIYEIGSCS